MEDKVLNNSNRRKGFTLIEILIVLVIIGILAAMAVSSFGSARKRARLNIAVDSVASMIKQQQGKAKTGRQTGVSSSELQTSCYGMVFQKTAPYIQTVSVPYVAVPPVSSNSPYADYCDTQSVSVSPLLTPVEVTDDIFIQDIGEPGSSVTSSVVMFKPPFGAVLQADSVSHITPESQPDKTMVRIFLNQTGNQQNDEQGIQYDPFSGLVSKVSATLPSTP